MNQSPPADDVAAGLARTVSLHRDDAADLADALRHAGSLLTRLVGDPAAQAAHHELTGHGGPELSVFALDLLVRAWPASLRRLHVPSGGSLARW